MGGLFGTHWRSTVQLRHHAADFMTGRFDAIELIEAGYAEAPDDARWLDGVVRAAQSLDQGLGVAAFQIDLGPPEARRLKVEGFSATVSVELSREALLGSLPTVPPAFLEKGLLSHPLATLASTRAADFGEGFAALWRMWARHNFGIEDALGILGMSPDGKGCVISASMPKAGAVAPRKMALLARVASHLASAARLRGTLCGASWRPEDPATEAVLDDTGRLHHLESGIEALGAKEILREAVRRTERARGPLRRTDPEEATSLWRGLVDGRWSLVDHVDRDGKRFILARRNEPDIRDPKALGPRERHVAALAARGHSNKHIAYQLGISATTVSSHLTAALRKLNLGSRRELVQALGGVA